MATMICIAQRIVAHVAFPILTFSGIDETTGQTRMARREYLPEDRHRQHTFTGILCRGEDGLDRIDYCRFRGAEPLI